MHPKSLIGRPPRLPWLAAAAAAAAVAAAPAEARVTRIVIDSVAPLTGQSIPYEQIRGRAFGELDPNDPHNSAHHRHRAGQGRRRQGALRRPPSSQSSRWT